MSVNECGDNAGGKVFHNSFLFIFLDPKGVVDKTLHNRDPAYLKHKYSYGNEEHSKLSIVYLALIIHNSNLCKGSWDC